MNDLETVVPLPMYLGAMDIWTESHNSLKIKIMDLLSQIESKGVNHIHNPELVPIWQELKFIEILMNTNEQFIRVLTKMGNDLK